MRQYQNKVTFVIIFIASLVSIFFPFRAFENSPVQNSQILGQAEVMLPVSRDIRPKQVEAPTIFSTTAEAAYAVDLKTGTVLYEKNSDSPWPTASLTKLMTALVVINISSLNDTVVVPVGIKTVQPVMGLQGGEELKVSDLLKGMLIMSANDAAITLSESFPGGTARFVELMNQMAERLQLTHTHFRNPAGFDEASQYSTAEDLAHLTFEFLRHKDLADIVQMQSTKVTSSDDKVTHWIKTSNKLLQNDNILGVKTGFTDQARGNLILLATDKSDNQILTVILGSEHREDDSMALVKWVYDNYKF